MSRVLLIDKTPEKQAVLEMLADDDVVTAASALDMFRVLERDAAFDVIVSSVETPDILDRLNHLYPRIPVIVLAANASIAGAVEAIRCGSADYLPRPVDRQRLLASIQAAVGSHARRKRPPAGRANGASDRGERFLHVRELTIDRHRLIALFYGEPLRDLTPTEFEILACLVENKGRVVLFEELAFRLHGTYPGHDEARQMLSAHIANLRGKLKKAGCEEYILSSRNRGYFIDWDVEAKLRRTEKRLSLMVQQVPVHLWTTDKDLVVDWIGGSHLAQRNIDADSLLGRTVQDALGEGDESVTIQAHRRALQGESSTYEVEHFGVWYRSHVEPLRDLNGDIVGCIGIALDITERKQAEERIKLQADMLAQVNDAVTAMDLEGRLTYWNQAAERIYGYLADEVIGLPVVEVLQPRWLDGTNEDGVIAALRETGSWHGEMIQKKKNGEEIYVDSSVSSLKDDGTVKGALSVIRDITERKRMEEALRESEARYRIISDMMTDYVYATRVLPGDAYRTELEWVAGALTRITGYTVEEAMRGINWDSQVHPDDLGLVQQRRQKLLAGQRDVSEFRMINKAGRLYWMRTYNHPVWDDQEGRVVRIYSAVQDITQRKQAEEALRQNEERYRIISEAMSDYVYTYRFEPDGSIVPEWMMGAYERITGYTLQEGLDSRLWDRIVHPDDLEIVDRRVQRLLARQTDITEYRIIPRSGEVRTLRVYGSPVWDEAEGRVVRVHAGAQDITEQKRIEEALRQSEWRYRSIFENALEGIYRSVPGRRLVDVNPAMARMLGYESVDEVLALTIPDDLFVDVAEWEHLQALHRRQDVIQDLQLCWKRKDGTPIAVSLYVQTLRDHEGNVLFYEGMITDITERKRAEEALRRSEAMLRNLVEHAPAPMMIFQEERVLFVNQAIETLSGYSRDEWRNMKFYDVIVPEQREIARAKARKRLQGEPVRSRYELKIVAKDGRELWIDYLATLVQFEGQQAILAIVADITTQKATEARLRQNEASIRALIESIPAPLLIFDDTYMRFVNPAAAALIGYTPEELRGMTFWEMIHPDMQEQVRQRGKARYEGQTVPSRYEVRLVSKQGEDIWVDYMGTAIEYEGGRAILGIVFDITARKRAEEALRQSEQRLEAERRLHADERQGTGDAGAAPL